MRGPAYPLQVDETGKIACVEYEELGASWIRAFMNATPGTRPMRQKWGANVKALQFDPSDPAMFGAYLLHQLRALEKDHPIRIDDVQCAPKEATNRQTMTVKVCYSMLESGDKSEAVLEV